MDRGGPEPTECVSYLEVSETNSLMDRWILLSRSAHVLLAALKRARAWTWA